MLAAQKYDNHTSIHDDATAQKLGFKGGTIEGPDALQPVRAAVRRAVGTAWLAQGCLSAHYRNACFEGEKVRAFVTKPQDDATQTTIRMEREDGTEILRGTAAIGGNNPPSALEQRISELSPPETLVILRDVRVGMRTQRIAVRMDADQHMGALYPFSLADKAAGHHRDLRRGTRAEGAASSPWKRADHSGRDDQRAAQLFERRASFPVRGPVVGLFADQEIRMLSGPLFVGEPYEIDREVVALSGSRRTESMWIRTRVFRPGSDEVLATMLLNSAYLKDSYPNYEAELKSQAEA